MALIRGPLGAESLVAVNCVDMLSNYCAYEGTHDISNDSCVDNSCVFIIQGKEQCRQLITPISCMLTRSISASDLLMHSILISDRLTPVMSTVDRFKFNKLLKRYI